MRQKTIKVDIKYERTDDIRSYHVNFTRYGKF